MVLQNVVAQQVSKIIYPQIDNCLNNGAVVGLFETWKETVVVWKGACILSYHLQVKCGNRYVLLPMQNGCKYRARDVGMV